MRLHRFFLKKPIILGETNTVADSSLIFQIKNVLRLRAGDKAVFFNGDGDEHESEIVSIGEDGGKEALRFRVVATRSVKPHSSLKLSLAFSLVKKDKTEWVIQKCTELGVSLFIPLVSERSEKKNFDLKRAEKIVTEASEQSGRTDIPAILEPAKVEDFLKKENKKLLVFHTEGANFEKKDFSGFGSGEFVVCIGPEGGWSEREVKMFEKKGAVIARLNAPVLRAETAAVAVSVLLLVK